MGLLALHGLAWELVALAAASSPPELSESSDSHLRLCRATSDRVGPNGAGLPRRGRPSETEGARHVHRRPGSSLPCRGRRGSREGLHVRPESAEGWRVGSKSVHCEHDEIPTEKSGISRFSRAYIGGLAQGKRRVDV